MFANRFSICWLIFIHVLHLKHSLCINSILTKRVLYSYFSEQNQIATNIRVFDFFFLIFECLQKDNIRKFSICAFKLIFFGKYTHILDIIKVRNIFEIKEVRA